MIDPAKQASQLARQATRVESSSGVKVYQFKSREEAERFGGALQALGVKPSGRTFSATPSSDTFEVLLTHSEEGVLARIEKASKKSLARVLEFDDGSVAYEFTEKVDAEGFSDVLKERGITGGAGKRPYVHKEPSGYRLFLDKDQLAHLSKI